MTWIPAQQCVLTVCLCRFRNGACQEIVFSPVQKTTNLKQPPSKKTLNALFNVESVLGFGLTLFVLDFFWLRESEQPTWCFTQHLSYHFWIWRWLNNLELILPLALHHIFAEMNSYLKLSVQHTQHLWVCCVLLIENTPSLQLFSDAVELDVSVKCAHTKCGGYMSS